MKRLRENICNGLARVANKQPRTVLHDMAELRFFRVTRAKFDLRVANGIPHLAAALRETVKRDGYLHAVEGSSA
jgi:hypothetical protein